MRLTILILLAGCAAAPPPRPDQIAFARAYVSRTVQVAEFHEMDEAAEDVEAPAQREELKGLLLVDPASVDENLQRPLTRDELAALAYTRSPVVAAAREKLRAVLTGYRQSEDLRDLVSLYRAFTQDLETRLGPERSRTPAARIAPSPNVDLLSSEIVQRSVAIAFEDLRATVRDLVAAAERAHADAARLAAARRILRADVELHEAIVRVLRSRLESGDVGQAGLLAFQARLETLRTELEILDREEAAVRARWNRLLSRPEGAPLELDVAAAEPGPAPDDEGAFETARAERQEFRAAGLRAERAAIAVRLAETMTLPRMDLGSSRFESERGEVFPAPGRMQMPRYDFGVKEAQVTEMRARQAAAERARDAFQDRLGSDVRAALFARDAASRRWMLHKDEVVPLAQRAFDAARGAYEGNRTGYVELLDRARGLLAARLGEVDARRGLAYANAKVLEAVGVRPPEESK